MHISGTFQVAASAEFVARSLREIDILRAAIPGCTGIEAGTGPGTFNFTAEVGIAGLQGEHAGVITVTPTGESTLAVTLAGSGASRIEATATLSLAEDGAKTTVSYEATLSARGAVARLGGKQIEGAAGLLVRQALRALKREIEARVS